MEVTVRLPKNLYRDVSEIAHARKKSVAEIIKNAVRKEVADEATRIREHTEIIKKSVEFCSDKEIMALASLKMPEIKRLSFLLQKNRESKLTQKERKELEEIIEQSRMADLRKAVGMVEAIRRGLIKSPEELV